MGKRFGWVLCIFVVLITMVFATQALAKTIKLKAVSAWPLRYPSVQTYKQWVKAVNEKSKGRIEIEIIGGPEVTPMPEQVGALKRGVFDILQTAAGYYMGMIPESEAFGLSRISPTEERENGFTGLMVEIHKKHGLMYLGRSQGLVPLGVLCLKNKITRPQELKGLKIRTVKIYDAFMRELGAVPVTIPVPEIYTSLERGLVDGFVQPLAGGFTRLGFHEVVNYIVKNYFYQIPSVILMNLKTLNKLPEQDRNLLTATLKEMEPLFVQQTRKIHDTEFQKAQEKGVKIIEFSPEDGKWFVDTAYRVSWENLAKKAPENVSKLRKLSTK